MFTDGPGRYKATSFSGTEEHRREQGTCPAYYRSKVDRPRFMVPAGTKCQIRLVEDAHYPKEWHTTEEPNGFDRYERRFQDWGNYWYEFRGQGWIMKVACSKVERRK